MTKTEDCEHQPRERRHILDPVTQVANTSTGDASRYVFYFCGCGQLNKVTSTTFRKRTSEVAAVPPDGPSSTLPLSCGETARTPA